jgi:hypothetical protein
MMPVMLSAMLARQNISTPAATSASDTLRNLLTWVWVSAAGSCRLPPLCDEAEAPRRILRRADTDVESGAVPDLCATPTRRGPDTGISTCTPFLSLYLVILSGSVQMLPCGNAQTHLTCVIMIGFKGSPTRT